MYHYITFGDIKIYMTGIGIILFIVTFLISFLKYAKKNRLATTTFIKHLPRYIIGIYLFSRYTRELITYQKIIPLSFQQLLLYFSPANYQFHFIGIIIGIFMVGLHFLLSLDVQELKKKRLDGWLHSLCLACIPLGIFLILGDNFIGAATQTNFFITAIRSDSNVAVYGKVLPLGLFLSLWGLVCHVIMNIYNKKTKKYVGYLGYAVFCLGLGIITLYQQYPRHLVKSFFGVTYDIKQYLMIGIVLFFVRQYLKNRKTTQYTESTQ